MRVADYIIEFLIEKGITRPFVVTGRGALFLNDALAKSKGIDPIFTHHEQGAGFAAVGGADVTQSPQAAIVSTGCASTNVITALLCAWQDYRPLVVISGQNTLRETTRHTGSKVKTYGQQEADIISIVEPICKAAVMLDDPKRVRYELERMFGLAQDGNGGPVWMDVPLDIQNAHVEPGELEGFDPGPTGAGTALAVADLEYLTAALAEAVRPVFLIGSGVRHGDATELLSKIAEARSIPVVYTASAVDIVPLSNPVSIGSFGSQGCSRAGAFAVQNSDLVIILGSRMNSLTTGPDSCKFARAARTVVVDISSVEHAKPGIAFDRLIQSDVKAVLEALDENGGSAPSYDQWLEKAQHWKALFARNPEFVSTAEAIDLYELAANMQSVLPDDGVFVCDSGFIDVIVPTNAPFLPTQRVVRSVSQGAMGFAIPGALGVAVCSSRPVLCIVGDGSIMMNIQELETIARYNLNIKIVVVLNGMYAIIKRRQNELFRGRTIGVDSDTGLQDPNFEQIAKAFGLPFLRCGVDNYVAQIRAQFDTPGSALITIPGKVDQEYIEIGYGRDAEGRLARRPLEDQKPFLDRETFRREMLIPTVDE